MSLVMLVFIIIGYFGVFWGEIRIIEQYCQFMGFGEVPFFLYSLALLWCYARLLVSDCALSPPKILLEWTGLFMGLPLMYWW